MLVMFKKLLNKVEKSRRKKVVVSAIYLKIQQSDVYTFSPDKMWRHWRALKSANLKELPREATMLPLLVV